MALYGTSNISATTPALLALAAGFHTQLQAAAATATLRRAAVYEWTVGPASIPNAATDCEIVWTLIRQTTAGTGPVTMGVNALDSVDAAAGTVVTGNQTAEPTNAGESGVIDGIGTNQRGGYRWVVSPGGPGELMIPATNLAGIGIRGKSSNYTGFAMVTMKLRE
jgi:hypothetical protein